MLEALPPVPRHAIERFARTNLEEWRYRRTRISEDGVTVDLHDPTQPGEAHWELVSIDGREPTEKERRDYNKDRADHSLEEERARAEEAMSILVAESLELVENTDGHQRYSYRLQSPNGKRERTFERLTGELLVVEPAGEAWVREIRVWNREILRPWIGLRVDEAGLEFRFHIQDGWVLPQQVLAHWSGEFLGLKDIERRYQFTLGDFERVRDVPRSPELAEGRDPNPPALTPPPGSR